MENDLTEIDKNQITTRLGRGKKRKISIDKQLLFKNAAGPNRAQERFQSWTDYAAKLEANLISLHEKMCSNVFDDILVHLLHTNEMLDIERMSGNDLVQLLPVLCLNTGINLPGMFGHK